jgi:hypothetical protein
VIGKSFSHDGSHVKVRRDARLLRTGKPDTLPRILISNSLMSKY